MGFDYQGLKALLDRFPMGMFFVNAKDEILLCNDRLSELLGVDPLDLMAQGLDALPAEMGLAPAVESLRRAADNQQEQMAVPAGRRWLSFTLVKDGLSLFDEPCVLVLAADITEQRKLEEFRAAALDGLLHRIRGPLTSVKTSLAFLGSDACADLPAPVREVVTLGHAEVQRLHTLVSEIGETLTLEGDAAEAGLYLENVEVEALLNKTLRRIRKGPAAQARELSLELAPEDRALQVLADYEKLGYVIRHLLDNALAYSPASAPVRITAAAAGADCAEISVEDGGPGITPEDMPHVFEKFYRSRDPRVGDVKGTGLGLFLAKSYVELMKGTLSLESLPGRGTTARVRLPLASRDGWGTAGELSP
jgi:signal transduction histidine kinase